MVSEITPRLVIAVAEHKRRVAESVIRKPNDIVVYVEGNLDRDFFNKHTSVSNLTFKNIGNDRGKTDVCSIVSSTVEYYGIVDMDHDFDSSKTINSRLIDTGQQCCLYSYVTKGSGSMELTNLVVQVVRHVCQRLRDPILNMVRNEMIDRLKYGGDKLENFVVERTKAILYRGYLGDKGAMVPSKEGEFLWSDIQNKNGNPVRDIISDSMSLGYETFKEEYAEQLSSAGVNDHAISDAMIIFFKDQYSGYSHREIQIKSYISRELNRLIIGKGNSDMADYFLSELGLIDNLND